MTQAARRQHALLALIKGRACDPAGDAWLEAIAGSRELNMIREIALWWRRFQIESQCRYTARLLKRTGEFEETAARYFDGHATSPFIEALGLGFLEYLSGHELALVRSVAAFEAAVMKAGIEKESVFEILWDRNPEQVILSLEQGSPLPEQEPRNYVLRVSRRFPDLIECVAG